MESVTLIAPKTEKKGGSDISAIRTPLTGLLTLATILDREGYEVRFYDESFKKPDYSKIYTDYVLISSMSATANRAYKIADSFKKRNIKVFMGGLHPSFKPKEALEHCDKVVVGEGDKVVVDLIKGDYDSDIIYGEGVNELDSIPMPDYDLVEGLDKPKTVSVCASRGCPYDCKFCSLKKMFGRKIRFASNEKVVNYLSEFDNLKTLCFDEPNFSADKERAIDLLKTMDEHGVYPKKVWASVSIDIADNEELLRWCSKVSEFNFVIGLESINQKVLNSYNKKQTPEKIKDNIKKIKDYGFKIEGSFVFGSDLDTKDVFQNTVEFCHDADIDFPAFFPLTPYVGTDTRKEMKKDGKIFTNNWDYYDNLHVVFYPKNMTPYELQKGVISCYEDFYTVSKGIKHIFKGEFFYGGVNFYLKYLFKKMIRENENYLEYLENISS